MDGAKGIILAAASSRSGKTLLTLGLLRAFIADGIGAVAAKAGPDYIDPTLHRVACGADSWNLDPWAMEPALVGDILSDSARRAGAGGMVLVEGVMGLFDGADDGRGSTASLAAASGLPVVLIVDARGQAQSVAAVARGFLAEAEARRSADGEVRVVGVIANRVGSARHRSLIERALAATGVPLLGAVREDAALSLPSRHLGLVPGGEAGSSLEPALAAAEARVREGVDLRALYDCGVEVSRGSFVSSLPVPHGVIGVARDEAFVFMYPHILAAWRGAGAEARFFSPLADEAPPDGCGFIFLPGGYPELHGERLAAAGRFQRGLRTAAAAGAEIYGECGGYMVLGRGLADAAGGRHEMAGLLPIETSFAEPRLHLGYRVLRADNGWFGGDEWRGHEFHYASLINGEANSPLFKAHDAAGNRLPPSGHIRDNVYGSFAHLISN
ncbi:MAG: cobyrinate a,c-diamide synthase [Alphaproteobacteria bacterium]|nr:cobyrinate a,c-diamide synthase [Alphaproteobacteria bacterium]